MQPPAQEPDAPRLRLSFGEFVAIIACLMAVTALGIDSMLPALPAIARSLSFTDPNQQQWIVASYVFGFGLAQIVYGPISDQVGRRRVLIPALVFYAAASMVAGLSGSFAGIVIARMIQGVAAAAARVLTVSIVRDCYGGRQMARVMSLSFMVFLAVPVLAPSIGTLILQFGSWRLIFVALGVFGLFMAAFVTLRLPETLHPKYRRPLSVCSVGRAARRVVTNRTSLGYTIASTLMFGGLMGFINSAQQIFAGTFGAAARFPLMFALVAAAMAASSLFNARVVETLGMRRLAHGALIGFLVSCALHLGFGLSGRESMGVFVGVQALLMGMFSLCVSNFNAMAMEPLGDIAGTASSIQGCATNTGGALIGILISQGYDGTTVPLGLGYSVCGGLTLLAVLGAERGRLFAPHHGA